MRMIAPLIALALLPACTTSTAEGPATPSGAGGKCVNTGLDRYVGQTVTADLGAELLAKSGARTLRWGPPGSAMTMDFREDRLTVSYDYAMAITRLSCG
jgi:hypothetical protein